jgi:hypothetical protein
MRRKAIAVVAVLALTLLPGCGDKDCGCSKPGGGGRSQSYDCGTGRYNLMIGGAALLGFLGWSVARRRQPGPSFCVA